MEAAQSTKVEPPVRSIGFLAPEDQTAQRAWAALQAGRIADATSQAVLIGEQAQTTRAWKSLLLGLVESAQHRFAAAERNLLEAVERAREAVDCPVLEGGSDQRIALINRRRLLATAMLELGRFLRRMDRVPDAMTVHEACRNLRKEAGSSEEQWEVTHELALDASVLGDWALAARNFIGALTIARETSEELQLQELSSSLSGLVRASLESGEVSDAVQHCRMQLELMERRGSGTLERFRAELALCIALLAQASNLIDDPPSGPSSDSLQEILEEARQRLDLIQTEFAAWGMNCEIEQRRCTEAVEFADRLHEFVSNRPGMGASERNET